MGNAARPGVSELIRRARGGDADCREQLFGLCRSYLGYIARAQVESWLRANVDASDVVQQDCPEDLEKAIRERAKVDASDVVQQTMMEAHRDFEGFEGQTEKEWLAWLRKILAHNVRHYRGTAKRQARREVPLRRRSESTLAGGAPEPAAPDLTPSEEFLRLDSELRVAAALAELPPDYQEVIVLRNLQRLPFNDVAEQMGRSRPAVQMLWMRAIRKLQEALGEEEENDE